MKRIVFLILFGSLLAIQSIIAQNDTILLYNYYYNEYKIEKFVLYVDQKVLNDSSKIYTLFSPCSWHELISTIPSEFHKVKNKALICFFYGNEDYSKIEEDYVMKYLDTLKTFLYKEFDKDAEFKLISWEKKEIKIIRGLGICDPPIFGVIIKNGKIIQESYAKSRLYWQNHIRYNIDYISTQ